MINGISTNSFNYQIPESQIERPEGYQGSSKDTFVRDQSHDLETEKMFRQMGQAFTAQHHSGDVHQEQTVSTNGAEQINQSNVCMYEGREGYKSDFLGIDYSMPELDDSIKDKASHLINHPDEIVLKYNHFSIVQNKERKQCFFTACNIDGTQSKAPERSGGWKFDGRIPLEDQLGNPAYKGNDIDKGHMVRRLDPAWGDFSDARLGSTDTFVYTNSALQHGGLNKVAWLDLENHVLSSAKGQKMTVLTGPVFSENDRAFNNHGRLKEKVQIPEKFWKVVVWKDNKTDQLKTCAFVISQSDILDKDSNLFKGGFNPDRFDIYQVPMDRLEEMTNLHFCDAAQDITPAGGCKLDEASGCKPQGL